MARPRKYDGDERRPPKRETISGQRQRIAEVTATTLTLSLAAKLGSVLAHLEEAASDNGHPFDVASAQSLAGDPEVIRWMAALRSLSLLPQRR